MAWQRLIATKVKTRHQSKEVKLDEILHRGSAREG